MELKILKQNFSICKVKEINNINIDNEFLFIGKTDDEISIVCAEECIPINYTDISENWKCIKIIGTLDFSLIGILSKISTILAENNISIFVVSTYNTDYVLVKEDKIDLAKKCLEEKNYTFI